MSYVKYAGIAGFVLLAVYSAIIGEYGKASEYATLAASLAGFHFHLSGLADSKP